MHQPTVSPTNSEWSWQNNYCSLPVSSLTDKKWASGAGEELGLQGISRKWKRRKPDAIFWLPDIVTSVHTLTYTCAYIHIDIYIYMLIYTNKLAFKKAAVMASSALSNLWIPKVRIWGSQKAGLEQYMGKIHDSPDSISRISILGILVSATWQTCPSSMFRITKSPLAFRAYPEPSQRSMAHPTTGDCQQM